MPRAGLSPAAVVDAALRVVDAGGPAALTLAAVAGECGVATPSLYKHVASLAELRGRLAARIVDELTAEVTAAMLGRSGDGALEALMVAYHAYATRHPHRYALVPQRPDPGDAAVTAAGERFLAVVFAVFKGYDLDGDRLVHATRVLRAAMHGFAVLHTEGAFQLGQDLAESHRVLIETMKLIRAAAGNAS
ncbi:TetR/AcrR family transcriptional regulator [Dactylosporangium sp. CA-233914]|uniref:TetR/AcrR family transcriptional regulator n=1 Tax=Dactylosporangium sp. CA-233914 TaxID=3239934 RepID=UPI003D92437F